MRQAFSLVELSIVLVILGLLTGGILAGQSLIRASELRSVSTEVQRYIAASQTFRDKYFALPGDMTNATKFWGKDSAACNAVTDPAGTPGTCNGDGNGQMAAGSGPTTTAEQFQYWKQMALAGLIEGTYTGLSNSAGPRGATIGSNVPRSKLGQAGMAIEYWGTSPGTVLLFPGQYDNIYIFGTGGGINPPEGPVLKPEEAWNIDTKMDDGKPANGKVRPFYRYNYASTACPNAAETDYNLSDSSIQCNLAFITGL